ncbi:hypothetical protein [Paenibacillus sp. 1-18]|uniref:hypothetical protein n=1 Tax=Paenibacillus sp. 1-18 TaxID=1333846 RepID=UPI00046EA5DE|nr:hypothetical protein [Paenibacillus sp. 1-18]
MMKQLPEDEYRRLYNQLLVQIELYLSGCRGLAHLCIAYGLFPEEDYPRAFIQASHAVWSYQTGKEALSLSETWKMGAFLPGGDWLTSLDSTIFHADTVRRFLRMQGDSPDMFLWYKQYIMPETERHIYLENTHRKPLLDDELARFLEKVLFMK